jgi:hypothetical protein
MGSVGEPEYQMRFRAAWHPTPEICRLKRLLKYIWRQFGFRVLEIVELKAPTGAVPAQSEDRPVKEK